MGSAKLPGDLKVTGDDVLEKYVLLANSHDGSLAVTMQLTAVRVVCANTMSVALASGQKFRALHTPNVISKANEAREFLGLTEAYFESLMAGVNRLVETKMNKAKVDEMVFKVSDWTRPRPRVSNTTCPATRLRRSRSCSTRGSVTT